ncbi:MAG: PASTA domain-containing protein [Gaiellaceae bacterium]
MRTRLTALLPRLVALTVIWLLGAATYTLAADTVPASQQQTAAESQASKPTVLIVPDVRRKAYVFAKGILQDAGFAWRVEGSVKGFAANTVQIQNPAPGTRVIDNGAPVVALALSKNTVYGERGLPENDAPYNGTRVVRVTDWAREHAETEVATTSAATTTQPAATTTEPAVTTTGPEPEQKNRKPDFTVPGAPVEPADEMSLPDRARALQRRTEAASKPSARLVNFWLYQHSWIVTGARFGWYHGAEALHILIKVDQSLERRFGFGARSEVVARRALAYVEAQAK